MDVLNIVFLIVVLLIVISTIKYLKTPQVERFQRYTKFHFPGYIGFYLLMSYSYLFQMHGVRSPMLLVLILVGWANVIIDMVKYRQFKKATTI